MSDLVKRLRNPSFFDPCQPICLEAADEIERLDRQVAAMVEAGIMTETEAKEFVLDDMRKWAGTECPLPYTHEFLSCLLEYEKDRMK